MRDLLLFSAEIRRRGKTFVVLFFMESKGERQFFEPTLKSLASVPDVLFVVASPGLVDSEFVGDYKRDKKIIFVDSLILRFGLVKKNISLFLNTEFQSLHGVYSICLFHGQPSKGVTFQYYKIWERFDAFFMYGPLHRESYESEVIKQLGTIPEKPKVFEIGYPKSDDLINGKYSRDDFLIDLGLDVDKKTVIYAPAFNEGASLRCFGVEIIETLCRLPHNVLAKLPIDCLQPTSNSYATGGVDWFEKIGSFQAKYDNFRLIQDIKIDPALSASDVMVTCISSVGLEFLAIGRPVIFFNTPKYFSDYLKKLLPDHDVESLSQKNFVNGGKEWGFVIDSPDELPKAISEVLSHPDLYPKDPAKLRSYLLYNPGNATNVAVDTILSIFKRDLL
jgi:glycosyltransferase involved in cell wall biosynthesis